MDGGGLPDLMRRCSRWLGDSAPRLLFQFPWQCAVTQASDTEIPVKSEGPIHSRIHTVPDLGTLAAASTAHTRVLRDTGPRDGGNYCLSVIKPGLSLEGLSRRRKPGGSVMLWHTAYVCFPRRSCGRGSRDSALMGPHSPITGTPVDVSALLLIPSCRVPQLRSALRMR